MLINTLAASCRIETEEGFGTGTWVDCSGLGFVDRKTGQPLDACILTCNHVVDPNAVGYVHASTKLRFSRVDPRSGQPVEARLQPSRFCLGVNTGGDSCNDFSFVAVRSSR